MTAKKNILSNVVVIRNILIILLVFYHAFAIYSGAWAPIQGFPEVPVYWWLDKLSYAFMLELFVFVSGYVFGYQVRVKGESKLQAKDLFWGKFKRLMIPCIVFSLLYILLLGDITQPIQKTLYGLFDGVGHMWFLPMLFWCFVGMWIIEKIHLKPKWSVPLLIIASLGSFLPLPLRMGTAMYFMVFFYVGYVIQRNNISLDWLYTKRSAIITTISFIILFPAFTLLKEQIGVASTRWGGGSISYKGLRYFNSNGTLFGVFFNGYCYGVVTCGLLLKETRNASLAGENRCFEFWCIFVSTIHIERFI